MGRGQHLDAAGTEAWGCEVNHTPGPWVIDTQELGECLKGHVPISSKLHGGLAQVVWRMEDDERTPRCEANAHLIASAPEMLKALQRLTHPAADDEDLEYALEVIVKATGGQS